MDASNLDGKPLQTGFCRASAQGKSEQFYSVCLMLIIKAVTYLDAMNNLSPRL